MKATCGGRGRAEKVTPRIISPPVTKLSIDVRSILALAIQLAQLLLIYHANEWRGWP